VPLLRKEIEILPADLFEQPLQDAPWFVAHVLSRREKLVARHATEKEIAFYLPQVEKSMRRSGRTFRSYLPLFPGYLFLRGDNAARSVIRRTDGVANILDVPDQEELHRELSQIRELQLRGATLTPLVNLVPGDPVKIVDGPFQGYVGVVVQEKGAHRLIVSVALLRKAVAVEFPREAVAPSPRRLGERPGLRRQ
jgi:Transcription antiterminator